MPGKEQHCTEGFPHHAHYITYCLTSSKSMIILFALVLWEPYKLSYQCDLIIIDSDCGVIHPALIWIIHVYLSVLVKKSLFSEAAKYLHLLRQYWF